MKQERQLKIKYPGRPTQEPTRKGTTRDYFMKTQQMGFATQQEREDYENMIKNLKYKLAQDRVDVIIMMGLKLLKDLTDKKIKIINIEEGE